MVTVMYSIVLLVVFVSVAIAAIGDARLADTTARTKSK
jgi:hypothetical protein